MRRRFRRAFSPRGCARDESFRSRAFTLVELPAVSMRKRFAFTLVELLVVIAIIGILVSLLLPAIQAAREAARRANCQSNMKNIALGVLNYESANKQFPQGYISTGTQVGIAAWAWSTFTLPYLEEQQLYDQLWPATEFIEPIDGNRAPGASVPGQPVGRNLVDLLAGNRPSDIALVQTVLPIFRCPSDSTPPLAPVGEPPDARANRNYDNGQWERHFNSNFWPNGFQPSISNYVGSSGFTSNPCTGSSPAGKWVPDENRCRNTGIFFGNSKISVKQIADGTAKTFLLGERDKYCLSGTWIGVRNPPGADMWSSRWATGITYFPLNHPTTGNHNTCTEGFSSAHSGGGYFAFCDGSVRFITDDISFDNAGNPLDCFVIKTGSTRCDPQKGGNLIGVYQRFGWRDDDLVIDDNGL